METASNETPSGLTWHDLQAALRDCATEDDVQKLLDEELAGQRRNRWVVRITGRLRALRQARENEQLQAILDKED